NKFLDSPQLNPNVAGVFGVANDHVPDGVYVSPRIGFSWTYGTADQIGAFTGAARVPRGIIRGGIGLFRNSLNAPLPGQAMINNGLPSGAQQITCVGSAVPTPDWSAYAADAANIPTSCVGGGGVFNTGTPNVTLFSPDYAAQSSIRSTLQW